MLSAELGAGPLALARAHRAHTARLLVETTPMAMADIAFASGFASVRQFNDTVREVYGVPPTTLRSEAGRRALPAAAGALVLRLPYRPPFDGAGLLAFFAARAVGGVEEVDGGTYRRTHAAAPRAGGGGARAAGPGRRGRDVVAGAIASARTCAALRGRRGRQRGAATPRSAKARGTHVVATLRLSDPRDLAPAVARLRRLLDLDADPAAVDAALAADPVLAPSVAAVPGIRLPGTVDPAETALRAVLGQQVSVAAARTAAARLAAALGERLPPALAGDGPDLLFPTAADRRRARRGRADRAGPAHRDRRRARHRAGRRDARARRRAATPPRCAPTSPRCRASARGPPATWRSGCSATRTSCCPTTWPCAAAHAPLGIDDLPRHADPLGPVAFLRRAAPVARRRPRSGDPHDLHVLDPRHPGRPVHRRRRRRRGGARLGLDRRRRHPPARWSTPTLRPAAVRQVADLGAVSAAITRYHDGDLGAVDDVPVRQRSGAFLEHAWDVLRTVPAGAPVSYTEYAAKAGRPAAVRAAASACARNAAALFVPCHRVLRNDGSLGGFRWGLPVKRWLLDHEAPR